RVGVGQVDDQTHYDLVVFQVIEEGTTGILGAHDVHRPAGGVYHQTLVMLGRIDIPDFLDADAVMLSVGFAVEVVFLYQLLADTAAAAFGEQGVLGTQFHAGGVVAFRGVAFAIDAQVAGDDTAHHAVLVDQRFLSGEARVDLHAQVFRLLGQPAAQVTQGNDVIAFVVHGFRHKEVWNSGSLVSVAQQIDVIALDRGVQRSAKLFPVGEEFVQGAWLEHGTGENVSANFGAFFDHADAD